MSRARDLADIADFNIDSNLTFGDNDKAIFGAGSDLQIYHDGSDSIISDQGTGDLKFEVNRFLVNNSTDTENMILATPNGAVRLYYNGSPKFETTASGIDVTGTVNITGDGDDLIVNSADYELALLGNRGGTGVDLDKAYFRMKAEGTNTIVLDTAGDSYFNGGNVGIGTSSPDEALHIAKSGNSSIRLGQAGSDYAYRLRANVSSSVNGGFLIEDAVTGVDLYSVRSGSSGYHAFTTNGSERMRILPSGGITFNGDTAAANALDDYEEGTFTPYYSSASGSFSSITYDTLTNGSYTKIGDRVFIEGRIRTDALTVGTAAGALYLNGLPFASNISAGGISVGYTATWAGNSVRMGYFAGNSKIYLVDTSTSTGNAGTLNVTDMATGSNSNYFYFSAHYRTSA